MINQEARFILGHGGSTYGRRALVWTEELARAIVDRIPGATLSSGGKNWLIYHENSPRRRIKICGTVRLERKGNSLDARNPWFAVCDSFKVSDVRENLETFCSSARKFFGVTLADLVLGGAPSTVATVEAAPAAPVESGLSVLARQSAERARERNEARRNGTAPAVWPREPDGRPSGA